MDPFEEFLKQKQAEEAAGKAGPDPAEEEENARREEDDHITWTGKRVRGAGSAGKEEGSGGGVGKYLKAALSNPDGPEDEVVEYVDEPEPEFVRKKLKGRGGFGDFSSWD